MFGLLFKLLSLVLSTVLPIFGSYRALNQNDNVLIQSWLMYWVVYSILFTLESSFGFFVNFLPFFQLFRLLFILWLVFPQTQGASQLYLAYVQPFLKEHEVEIGDYAWFIYKKSRTLGIEYLTQLLYYVKEYAAHFILKSEVRPYPAAKPEPFSKEERFNGGVGKGSLVDTFFAQFKQPPSFVSGNNSTTESSTTSSNVFSSFSNNTEPSSFNLDKSSLFGAAFKFGASAIQSSLQLSKISKTNESLSSQIFKAPPSPMSESRSVSGQSLGVATGVSSVNFEPVNTSTMKRATGLPNENSELGSKSSSTNSLNTDFDFAFVKPDENSIDSQPLQRNRSSSWFSWRKSSQTNGSQETISEKPASERSVSDIK